ncbi:hypothetical protein L4D21_08060 [Photobacterium profundum]|uniref:hypothetical protein n=1 Tax=Photobacterium profundum TaxID=74109 RepID=UPI003D0D8F43
MKCVILSLTACLFFNSAAVFAQPKEPLNTLPQQASIELIAFIDHSNILNKKEQLEEKIITLINDNNFDYTNGHTDGHIEIRKGERKPEDDEYSPPIA